MGIVLAVVGLWASSTVHSGINELAPGHMAFPAQH